MKRMKVLTAVLSSLSVVLVSGIVRADDTVDITLEPGSSIRIRTNPPIMFGSGSVAFGEVVITDDGSGAGTLFAPINRIFFDQQIFSQVTAQLRAQSDATGTYNRNTGATSASMDLDVKFTSSSLSGFDNDNCIIPVTRLSLSTESAGGSRCSGGVCAVTDNVFVVDKIPDGRCGCFMSCSFVDYAQQINSQFGLPSLTSGDNAIQMNITMSPPLAP